jgi:hypothetical protein
MKDPIRLVYQNLLDQVVGVLKFIGRLTIKKDDTNCHIVKRMNYYTSIDPIQISRLR